MSQTDPINAGQAPQYPTDSPDEAPPSLSTLGAHIRLLMFRAGAWLGAFGLCALLFTGVSGWYTSRPQFCNSCHIMEPYYVSWQKSTHANVACTKCHFPPGVGEKVRGKLLGLVQLAKYVTATAGPNPSAEVPDASCLRSGCHETRMLSGRVNFHGIPFDHAPHLGQMRRGKQLRCTSCHSQIVQGSHMTVTPTTCYLCHFKDNQFNEGLGACTRCHQIPAKEYDLGGNVKFTHELSFEKGVDCANCHGDLIRGNGEVPVERCTVCHSREDDLKKIGDHTFMHQKHITEHGVDCISCHLKIDHSRDPLKIEHAASDCKSCHPNQHAMQVAMLTGSGSRTIGSKLMGMAAVRIACPTCHQLKEVSPSGTVLMKASLQACSACHDAASTVQLETYHSQLKDVLGKMPAEVQRVRDAIASAEMSAERKDAIGVQLQGISQDVNLLQGGNDIHNSHYASTLAESVVSQLTQICGELKIDPPAVTFPAKPDPPKRASVTQDAAASAAKPAAAKPAEDAAASKESTETPGSEKAAEASEKPEEGAKAETMEPGEEEKPATEAAPAEEKPAEPPAAPAEKPVDPPAEPAEKSGDQAPAPAEKPADAPPAPAESPPETGPAPAENAGGSTPSPDSGSTAPEPKPAEPQSAP